MRKKIRIILIRQGLIKPASLKESREVFPFPAEIRSSHIKGIGIARSMEALHFVHKKAN